MREERRALTGPEFAEDSDALINLCDPLRGRRRGAALLVPGVAEDGDVLANFRAPPDPFLISCGFSEQKKMSRRLVRTLLI